MSYFIPSIDKSPDFEGCTLVLPALSLGNVGQMTLDLLIPSLQIPHVGYLDDPVVLPCAGNDAYTKQGTGVVCSNLELFHLESKKLILLQQRAPVASGRNGHFVANLMKWAQESKIKQIVLLLSSDAAYRTPTQMEGSRFRIATTATPLEHSKTIPQLEDDSMLSTIKVGTVAQKFYTAAQEAGFPLSILTVFCAEGDNIPDAIQMATQLSQMLSLKSSEELNQWVFPSSWASLMQSGPVDRFLFG